MRRPGETRRGDRLPARYAASPSRQPRGRAAGAINPFVAETGFGDVWVLDDGGSTIWRIRGG
jgi:hypothetical protein